MNQIPPLPPPSSDSDENDFWVHDPLLGNIRLTNYENILINSGLFSRLSYIKQNSFVYFVYPVANHTRLQHSLGVMHLVDFAFSSIWLRIRKTENDTMFENTRKFIRLAALLHDIGHGPLSHISEMLLELLCCYDDEDKNLNDNYQNGSNKDEDQIIFEKFNELKKSKKTKRGKLKPHESRTKELIMTGTSRTLIIEALKRADFDETDSKNLIEILSDLSVGDLESKIIDENSSLLQKYFGEYYRDLYWVNDLIASDFDMDRLEYYLRDTYFAGVSETIIDYQHILISLMQSVEVIEPPNAQLRRKIVVEEDRGIGMFESLLVTRSLLYPYVYEHTTARSVNALLMRAFHQIILEKRKKIGENKWKDGWMEWKNMEENGKNKCYNWIKPTQNGTFKYPGFYNDTDISFIFHLASFMRKLNLKAFAYSIENIVYRELYKKCRYKDENYPGKKRPLYIRYNNLHPEIIEKIKNLTYSDIEEMEKSNGNKPKCINKKLLLWIRKIEYELEVYIYKENKNFDEWSKNPPSFIIDFPELPEKQRKEQGVDLFVLESGKQRSFKKFTEKTEINKATEIIQKRDWLISIYSNKPKKDLEDYGEKIKNFITDYFVLGGLGSGAHPHFWN